MAQVPIPLRDALRVEAIGPQTYKAVVPSDHCNGIFAHGGFLVSLVLTAIKHAFQHDFTKFNQPDTIDLHLTFFRPALAGDVKIVIKDAQLGPNTSTFRFSLSQKTKFCLTGFASNTNLAKQKGLSFPTSYQLLPAPAPVNFHKLQLNQDPNWIAYNAKWDPKSPIKAAKHTVRYYGIHSTAHNSITEFWCRPTPDHERFTNEMLGSFVDTYPRMVENMRDNGTGEYKNSTVIERNLRQRNGLNAPPPSDEVYLTYPTLSLTLEQKKLLPPEGARWLYMRAESKRIINGRFDVEIVVCDEFMDIVALSHQVNLIIDLSKQKQRATGGTAGQKKVDLLASKL